MSALQLWKALPSASRSYDTGRMDVGMRELGARLATRWRASLQETISVTDRGRPVAVL